MKLAVFYHLAALNHLWKDFIDEQLGLIQKVGLADVAKTYVCYVAPDEYYDDVKKYLNKEYSFATILSSRRTTEENLYEGQTLKELQEYSKNNDGYVLYLHSKGVLHSINSYQTIPTRDWRHYMNYWMVERWKDCVEKLETVSVVGTNYNKEPYPHLSGNFWWAATDYIRTLPDVLNRSLYYDESLTEKLAGYTFSQEMWVLYNKPQVHSIHYSHTNHYLEPYPKEKYATMLNYNNLLDNDKTLSLDELAIKYWTDKNSNCHDYCVKYEKYLPFKRDEEFKMLELGIDKGNSLKMWSKYFYNSLIVGIDNDKDCKQYQQGDKILVEIGLQNDAKFLTNVCKKYGLFDLIMDDCSHQQDLTLQSFEILFPLLKNGGTYVIEDVSCSYWEGFKGGYKKPGTVVEYFKDIIDDINFKGAMLPNEYGVPNHIRRDDYLIKAVKDYNLNIKTDIESILFINSIIIIHKRK